ncbi:hypothetical protein DUZ99_10600 [Xylanibacillus composti]|uniref:Leucine-rich repeat domain-containing protein n=1 Tax=Xylanibacillus composti TaxID=1572762 RepID=A0A8J4H5W3_9BACL|nr:hypothetical protein [Xylanibacillus composti]MDT9725419.1 hypothetical protein [Xylanibacillus composti]GIQ71548.1 hypothetical protein XYCOK13_43720 [Xylanibacillus composti]
MTIFKGESSVLSACPPEIEELILKELNPIHDEWDFEDLESVTTITIEADISKETLDLHCLSQLPNLSSLHLIRAPVEDYTFLYDLPNLSYLAIHGFTADQLPDFNNLHISNLELFDGDIENLDFLSYQKNLISLTVVQSQLINIDGIKNNKGLVNLLLSYNPISDISLMENLPNLERIEIRSTQVMDISVLAQLPKLKMADIRDTNITSVEPLINLPNLQILLASKDKLLDLDKLPDRVNVSETTVLAY